MVAVLQNFSDKRILVVGDVMLDRFIYGAVSRISPEAPVPVVEVERESYYPGGAANVARNLTPFTNGVSVCGLCGDDHHGGLLRDSLESSGADTSTMLVDPGFSTVCKTRIIARQQQVVRIDREKKTPLTPDQEDQVVSTIKGKADELDGIIIEDYAKGFLSSGLVQKIVEVAQGAGVLTTVDPNPRNRLTLSGVSAVKPNRLEAFQVADVVDEGAEDDPLQDTALIGVGEKLLDLWDTPTVLITLGEHGMMLFERGEDPHHIPTAAKEVYDVSGAGDTAIAVFTMALCAGMTSLEAAELSNRASGIVVGKLGTAALTPDDFTTSP